MGPPRADSRRPLLRRRAQGLFDICPAPFILVIVEQVLQLADKDRPFVLWCRVAVASGCRQDLWGRFFEARGSVTRQVFGQGQCLLPQTR